jgi:hypothetical protein
MMWRRTPRQLPPIVPCKWVRALGIVYIPIYGPKTCSTLTRPTEDGIYLDGRPTLPFPAGSMMRGVASSGTPMANRPPSFSTADGRPFLPPDGPLMTTTQVQLKHQHDGMGVHYPTTDNAVWRRRPDTSFTSLTAACSCT